MNQIYKNGCWGCKRAWESEEWPNEQYICPKLAQHQKDYENLENHEWN